MATHDKDNREYAIVKEVKTGDILECDGDFDCLEPWTKHEVFSDENKELYIKCLAENHYLDGQYNDEETHYVGLYKV